jgi:hypothetical protein
MGTVTGILAGIGGLVLVIALLADWVWFLVWRTGRGHRRAAIAAAEERALRQQREREERARRQRLARAEARESLISDAAREALIDDAIERILTEGDRRD